MNSAVEDQPGRFCGHCGTPVATAARFCSSCGEALVAMAKALTPPPVTTPPAAERIGRAIAAGVSFAEQVRAQARTALDSANRPGSATGGATPLDVVDSGVHADGALPTPHENPARDPRRAEDVSAGEGPVGMSGGTVRGPEGDGGHAPSVTATDRHGTDTSVPPGPPAANPQQRASGGAPANMGGSPSGQRRFIGAAGVVATVAFFLPWFSVCGESMSGAAVASAPSYSNDGSAAFLWVIPVLGAALAVMAFRGVSRNPLIWISFSGAAVMAIVYASVTSQRINVVSVEYGFVLDAVAFTGASVLAATMPRAPT